MSNASLLESAKLDKFCGSPFWVSEYHLKKNDQSSLKFTFQNSSLTWKTDDPSFTRCFEQTVLVWIPCLFIWIFSPLEYYYQEVSFNRYIPWNWKNFSKVLINALIFAVCFSDFISSAGADVFERVDIFMPLLKVVTFVSIFFTNLQFFLLTFLR